MTSNGIDFTACMEDVAMRLIGSNLNKQLSSRHELRFGTHGSLSVDTGNGTWFDHEAKRGGGVLEFVCAHNGCNSLAEAAEWVKNEILHHKKPQIVATYDYRDEKGDLIFQVVRYEPKTFRQRRPDPEAHGGWNWSVKGIVQVPYRLQDLLAQPDAIVFITEGEKDADNLAKHGLLATCNAGGALKWPSELNKWFKDRAVIILPDNDDSGREHGPYVAYRLKGIASRIRILELPDLEEKGDVSNWLSAGRTIDELLTLAERASEWTPHADASQEPEPEQQSEPADDLPVIQVRAGERHQAADAGMDALIAAGVPIYRRDRDIVYVCKVPAKASDGSDILVPGIMTVPAPLLARHLGQAAVWQKYDGRSKKAVRIDPPSEVVTQINEMPNDWRFQPLTGIIGTQTMRPDGSILDQPGYDPATGMVLFDPPKMPAIPSKPDKDRAIAALNVLKQLLAEFPFAGKDAAVKDASRSVALSMLMTPVLRAALPPAVPLHEAKSPHPGSGKSYLGDCASAIATGEICAVIGRSPNKEENEKRLHTAAMTGQSIISVDNVNGVLSGEFLCQLVERPRVLVRVLGLSKQINVANTFTVFANGNNIEIVEDLVRRAIQCSLDPSLERPETRQFEFNPVKEILAERGLFVAAVLTIARAYICAGMPEKPAPYMSFDLWSELVRGSLLWLGCADPIDTVTNLAKADPVRQQRSNVFQAINKLVASKSHAEGYSVAELFSLSERRDILGDYENPELRTALLSVASKDSGTTLNNETLGWWLRRATDQIADGLKLVRDDSTSRTRYLVTEVAEPAKPA